MNSLKKSPYFKTIALTGFVLAFSLFGFEAVFGYGGGGGRKAISPNVTAVNYPLTLLPEQEGNATSNFGQQATVTLNVPKGAVEEKKTTFKIKMSGANANIRPGTDAYIVGNKVFSITAAIDIEHTPVTSFSPDLLKITISMPEMESLSGLGIYSLGDNEWNFIATVDDGGTASFDVSNLATFSIISGGEGAGVSIAKKQHKEAESESSEEDGDKPEVSVISVNGKAYANGALIRAKNKKIYVINNGVKQHISSLKELRKYAGQPIADVDDETLAQYGGIGVSVAEYGDGALIRGKNMKVYVIVNGVKQHIGSLKELRKYAGQPIADVDDEALAQYGGVSILGTKYGNGALLRGKNFKTYVIVNGKKKHIVSLEELRNYAGQAINNVDDSVLEQY